MTIKLAALSGSNRTPTRGLGIGFNQEKGKEGGQGSYIQPPSVGEEVREGQSWDQGKKSVRKGLERRGSRRQHYKTNLPCTHIWYIPQY